MQFKIHFELSDGSDDSIILSGDTVEDIRAVANDEIEKRGGKNPWSEEIQPAP